MLHRAHRCSIASIALRLFALDNFEPLNLEPKIPRLHVENVYKRYGARTVLDNIDLSVASGELCTVVGPSGCGKSTLLRIVVGQEAATDGNVLIDGEPVRLPDAGRGIVYQKYSLYPHLTALENVLLGKVLEHPFYRSRSAAAAHRDEAMELLARARIAEHADKYPHELSGGMQQRVAIAQTLIKRPRIVLMDEPFGALDPAVREEMQVLLLQLWEAYGMTVFFVTHDLEEAVYLGTRVLVLSQYYTDDRGPAAGAARGARIVADHALPRCALPTVVKSAPEFNELAQRIRREGFDPGSLRHVRDFNLQHPDAFQTLTPEEDGAGSRPPV
jgi:NitT/TauT family transport system ATP-binding protein